METDILRWRSMRLTCFVWSKWLLWNPTSIIISIYGMICRHWSLRGDWKRNPDNLYIYQLLTCGQYKINRAFFKLNYQLRLPHRYTVKSDPMHVSNLVTRPSFKNLRDKFWLSGQRCQKWVHIFKVTFTDLYEFLSSQHPIKNQNQYIHEKSVKIKK